MKLIFILALLSFLLVASAFARERTYLIKVTNITRGQVITPPFVVTHSPQVHLFNSAEAPSQELAAFAENVDSTVLLDSVATNLEVFDYAVAKEPLPPGESVTLEVRAAPGFLRLSAVGMLATSGDALFGLDTLPLSGSSRSLRISVPAYHAGNDAVARITVRRE